MNSFIKLVAVAFLGLTTVACTGRGTETGATAPLSVSHADYGGPKKSVEAPKASVAPAAASAAVVVSYQTPPSNAGRTADTSHILAVVGQNIAYLPWGGLSGCYIQKGSNWTGSNAVLIHTAPSDIDGRVPGYGPTAQRYEVKPGDCGSDLGASGKAKALPAGLSKFKA